MCRCCSPFPRTTSSSSIIRSFTMTSLRDGGRNLSNSEDAPIFWLKITRCCLPAHGPLRTASWKIPHQIRSALVDKFFILRNIRINNIFLRIAYPVATYFSKIKTSITFQSYRDKKKKTNLFSYLSIDIHMDMWFLPVKKQAADMQSAKKCCLYGYCVK